MALTKITTSVIAANTLGTANIADNSIDATKIAANSILTRHIDDNQITGDQLADDITIAGNLTITGDLTTNGSTVTNSSTNTTIEDALIELGTGTSGAPATDAGIVIERGSSDNVFIGWDESADKVTVGTGSFTGASSGNLTITPAPFVSGALTASGLSYPTSDGTNGQVLKTDGSGALTFGDNTTKVDNYTATGDGSTTAFDTGINPGSEVNTWIFIDGVYQQKSQYSYSGSTVTFSTAPENGALIDVITGTSSNITASDTVLGVYEATTTNTDTYSTGISASNENNTWVFVGGVYQPKDSYTFSSGTLTFDANTPTGQKLSVVATKTITAGSVDTSTIAANAVTAAKIASNSILSRHIVNNSIVGADISATTQITANTFTGALTGNVTGNVAGNLTGTVLTAAQTNITSVGTLSALTVSGQLTAGGLSYPTSDGTNEQVLRTDGSGNLSFGTVSGTTLNNNTNNYVMTGTGTANTLNGESGLIFDGTNLGIGASSPDELLTLRNADPTLLIQGNQTSGAHYSVIDFKNQPGSVLGTIGLSYIGGATEFYRNTPTSWSHVWKINNSEKMRIDSSGHVGIGTNSPSAGLLTLSGVDGGSTAGIYFNNTTASTGKSYRLNSGNTGEFMLYDITSSAYRIFVNTSGNVGIGTTSPATKLHVEGTAKFTDYLYGGGAGKLYINDDVALVSGKKLYIDGGSNTYIHEPTADNMAFIADGAEVMRTVGGGSAAGSLRVGVTGAVGSSNSKLTVVGSWGAFIKATSYANYAPLGLWQNGGSSGDTLTYVTFTNNASASVGSITSVGSTTSYNTSSDYRLKENVDYTWDATTRLKQLKPARFNWISDETDTLVDGFLAHEVSSIVPEAITGVKDETETNQNCVLNAAGVQEVKDVTEAEWIAGKLPVLWTENDELPDGVSVGDIREEAAYASDTTWVAEHTQDVYQSIDQAKLVPLLVKTIQELEERITALEG